MREKRSAREERSSARLFTTTTTTTAAAAAAAYTRSSCQDIFDLFDPNQTGSAVRAEMLVGFMEDKSILLSAFPKHTSEIPQVGSRWRWTLTTWRGVEAALLPLVLANCHDESPPIHTDNKPQHRHQIFVHLSGA
mmetsp:Transcript_56278/g.155296  ORF Transcript_56278/g.155296 Transcript_56278/m.155296 type:complete len:135 (-) Transcript_56278:129-533(-)